MIYYIEDALLVIFELFCCKLFYEIFGQKRYKDKKWLDYAQFALLCVLGITIAEVLADSFLFRQVAVVVMISTIMYWHLNISYKKSLALMFLYEGLLLVVDYVTFFVIGGLFFEDGAVPENYMLASHLLTLLGKVVLFLCALILRKQFGKNNAEVLADTEWFRFLLFPVFTIVMITVMLSVFGYVEMEKQANLLVVFAFGIAGMNIVVFWLINDILKRELKIHENQIFQMQVKNQTEMYRSISENLDNQKRKTHEYKNQIICMESLLGKKQYDELEQYVKGIYGDLNKEPDAINTNNVIVNAILNTKYQEMTDKGIVFVFRLNDLSDLGMRDEDVVTILSNLLNNAIEACEQCKGKRIIRLKFVKETDRIIIAVKNTFEQALRYENGEIRSTKSENLEEHGIGIRNIERIVEKYKGSYVIKEQEKETEGKEFFFSIVLPLEQDTL